MPVRRSKPLTLVPRQGQETGAPEALRSETTAGPACPAKPGQLDENGAPFAADDLDRMVQTLAEMALVLTAGQAELAGLQRRAEMAKVAAIDLLSASSVLGDKSLPDADAAVPVNPLTDQESAVLRLLAEGHTDDVVARRIGVSARTVRRIVTVVMRRLDARSRFEAGARAAQRGWLPGTPDAVS